MSNTPQTARDWAAHFVEEAKAEHDVVTEVDDGQGNLHNWWTDADNKEFEKRTACIVDQFNSFDALLGV